MIINSVTQDGDDPMPSTGATEQPNIKITPKPPRGCAMLMMDLFRTYLHQHHLPLTHQREAIAMALFEGDHNLSVDELETLLRDRDEHVGKATIYRTLNLMVEAGLAREHDFGEGFKRYEPQAGDVHHDHLVCTECGVVERFSLPVLDELQHEVASRAGFDVQSRRLAIYGLCARCAGRSEEIGDAHALAMTDPAAKHSAAATRAAGA